VEALALPLGEGWVLCRPDIERLAVLNATGKTVWDMLGGGLGQQEIAAAFAEHFGLPAEEALANIRAVIGGLEQAGFLAQQPVDAGAPGGACASHTKGPAVTAGPNVNCGTFQFGDHRVEVHSNVACLGSDYFARFRNRVVDGAVEADVLEFSSAPGGYRLTFRGEVLADVSSLAQLIGRAHELILKWEHPECEFLAYFHAAAVSRGERSVLLPASSGAGKSTLTAFLANHAFAYLGDDSIAMTRLGWSLRPLPTCLSLKSGSWPILTAFYPELPCLPAVHCHGHEARYVEPRQVLQAGNAPSFILFPSYAETGDVELRALAPLETMMRLIDAGTALRHPATSTTLAEFLQFVEQTPAYELVYSDLPSAKTAIEEWLDHTS
jgi:Coenzyme PQQ synthesis protein D (PqqD)